MAKRSGHEPKRCRWQEKRGRSVCSGQSCGSSSDRTALGTANGRQKGGGSEPQPYSITAGYRKRRAGEKDTQR